MAVIRTNEGAAATPSKPATPAVAPVSPALAALEHYLPPNVVNGIKGYFTNPALSVQDANAYALQYVRTTPWYTQTYPGIQQGINNGLFNDEAGYRAYHAQLNQLYHQYFGQGATLAQVAHAATQGFTPSRISAGLQGQSYAATNAPEIQYTLGAQGDTGQASQAELKALGQEQAGIDTPLGQVVQKRLQQTQTRLQGAFKGVLANPSLGTSGGRLVTGFQSGTPDIGS